MKSHIKPIARLAALLTLSVVALAPSFASAAISGGISISFGSGSGTASCNPGDITGVACNILYIINDILVPVLFSIAFIVFLYGVFAKYILSNGDQDKVAEGHKLILWGLIGFAVMISIWGLVNVVANTFGLTGSSAPCLPSSTGGGC